MNLPRELLATATALFILVILLGSTCSSSDERTLLGPRTSIGDGTARTFVQIGDDGAPEAIGVALSEEALHGLPTEMNMASRCFDKDGNGALTHGECLGDYQNDLALPEGAAELGLPFQWVMVNWNPKGHLHPAPPVWGAPHFDIHFYLADPSILETMRPGPCGELIDCDDFKTASTPLPDAFAPAGYIDVGAAVPAMGNHLVDSTDPELLDPALGFSRTLIYGTYDAQLIFIEPMVSHAFLSAKPDACNPVVQPQAWAEPGYYPEEFCVRYDPSSATYRVSLEGLVYRQGS